MKKIKIPNEIFYLAGICGLALAVAMIAASNFGVSPIIAPAYVLSCSVPWITFGQAEYLVQGMLLIALCFIMGGFRTVYLSAFGNCLIYGAVLDLWRRIFPLLNPHITAPGSMSMEMRLVLYTAGTILTGVSVSAFFKSYMYPQLYDFFVRCVSMRFDISRLKFKLSFDFCCLIIGISMSLAMLGHLEGIGIGTFIAAGIMGFLIEFFCKVYDKYLELPPAFPSFAEVFRLH